MDKPKKRYYTGIIFALIVIIYSVFSQLTPFEYDNFVFDNVYLSYNGGNSSFSFRAWLDYANELRLNDNMRLSNLLAPITSMMMPKWLFSLLTGFCMGTMVWSIYIIVKSCNHTIRQVPLIIVIWAAIIVFLPWRNNIFTGDYAINYIYSGALSLLFIIMLNKCTDEKCGTPIKAVTAIMALVIAAWHEGFALPLAAGIAVDICISKRLKRYVPATMYVALTLLIVVGLTVFLCPGMIHRFISNARTEHAQSLLRTILNNCLTFSLIAIVAYMSIMRTAKATIMNLLRNRYFVILSVSAIAGTVISVVVSSSDRTSFAPQLFAVSALGILTAPILLKTSKRVVAIITTIIALLLAAHSALIIFWQYKLYTQFCLITSLWKENPGSTVFYDIIMPETIPLTTLGFPSRITFVEEYTYRAFATDPAQKGAAVVPSALKCNLTLANIRKAGDVLAYRDALFCPVNILSIENNTLSGIVYANIVFKDGSTKHNCPVFFLRFKDTAGTPFFYFKPYKISSSLVSEVRFKDYDTAFVEK